MNEAAAPPIVTVDNPANAPFRISCCPPEVRPTGEITVSMRSDVGGAAFTSVKPVTFMNPVEPTNVEFPVEGLRMRSCEGPCEAVTIVPYSDDPTHSNPVNDPESKIREEMPAPVLISNSCPSKIPSGNCVNA